MQSTLALEKELNTCRVFRRVTIAATASPLAKKGEANFIYIYSFMFRLCVLSLFEIVCHDKCLI